MNAESASIPTTKRSSAITVQEGGRGWPNRGHVSQQVQLQRWWASSAEPTSRLIRHAPLSSNVQPLYHASNTCVPSFASNMRLINVKTFEMREFADPPRYAILSHRWTAEELAFQDYHKLHELNTAGAEKVKQFCAFVRTLSSSTFPEDKKIQICTEWAWIDTCCIDKRSSSELNEAINSMWTWYSDAYYCVAYLKDVQMSRNRCESQDLTQAAAEESLISNSGLSHALDFTQMATPPMLKTEVVQSEWFTRGWVCCTCWVRARAITMSFNIPFALLNSAYCETTPLHADSKVANHTHRPCKNY